MKTKCEQCGKKEPSGLATCEGCQDRICNDCATPEWDVPGSGNSGLFRCPECYAEWAATDAKEAAA